jgi:hypothetical protein
MGRAHQLRRAEAIAALRAIGIDVLGNQAIQSLSVEHSNMEVRQRQSFGLEVPAGEESGS